jgi:hypothetical protein
MSSREHSREGSEVGSDREDEGVTFAKAATLEDNLELLGEKRGSTREGALEFITRDMRNFYRRSFVEKNKVTLIEACKKGMKKGTPKEYELSAVGASLLCFTLGTEDAEEIFEELSPILKETITTTSNADVRCAAIEAIAYIAFVAPLDEAATIGILDILAAVFDSTSSKPNEAAHAMKSWALLVTTVTTKYVHSILLPKNLSTFVTYLQNDDVGVRMSAGECIALLFECARSEEEENFDIYEIGQYSSVDIDELLDTLYELSQDKTKQRAKKDKLAQRAPFKDITNAVETGEAPKEVLSFKFQNFTFDSWTQIIQLNAIRELFGTGLHVHFASNELLQDIFDIELDQEATKTTYSQKEKRLLFSPSSPFAKAKTKNLTKARSVREQALQSQLATSM